MNGTSEAQGEGRANRCPEGKGSKVAEGGGEGEKEKEDRPKRVRKRQEEGAGEEGAGGEGAGEEEGEMEDGSKGKQDSVAAKGKKSGAVVTSTSVDDPDIVPRSLDLWEDKTQKGFKYGPHVQIKGDYDGDQVFGWAHG